MFLTGSADQRRLFHNRRSQVSDKDSLFVRYTFSTAIRRSSSDLAADNFQRSRNSLYHRTYAYPLSR